MGEGNGDKHTQKWGKKGKCENYRGITLLQMAYRLFADIIKSRLNEHVEDEMAEEERGFRKGCICNGAIFTVQQIVETRKGRNLTLFLLFIEYRNAYHNVNREKLWEMMGNKIPKYLLSTIKCICR